MKIIKFKVKILYFALLVSVFLSVLSGPAYAYMGENNIKSAVTGNIFKKINEYIENFKDKDDNTIDVPVLMYHHIDTFAMASTTVTPETFENHIKALTDNGYTGVFFEELIDFVENGGELPDKPIVITFDDGYLSNYEFAYPILKKYNMKATIFVIGVSVGKDTYRNTENSKYPIIPHFCYEQANEMTESGLVSIQSHTYDMHHWDLYEKRLGKEYRHGILSLESESEEEYIEIFHSDYMRSKTEIEAGTKSEVTAFAYPYGTYTEFSEILLKEMGVKVTVTTKYGSNKIIRGSPETLYLLNRYTVDNMPSEKLLKIISQ